MPKDPSDLLATLASEDYCYLTTTGRVSGRSHEIEIWFGANGSSIYLMAGNHRSDWVLNLVKHPTVKVRVSKHHFEGTARLVKDAQEELSVRYRIAEKYQELEDGRTLSQWARLALVVRIDLLPTERD